MCDWVKTRGGDSHIMFALFLNDLELFISDSISSGLTLDEINLILILFADDMVILGSDPLELQNSLDKLGIYCDTWGLEVNVDKTNIMVFRNRGRVPADNCWNYKGQTIEIVDDF